MYRFTMLNLDLQKTSVLDQNMLLDIFLWNYFWITEKEFF